MRVLDPEIGARYGRLVVTGVAERRWRNKYFNVVCDCGVAKEVAKSSLTSGDSSSCGCLQKELVSVRRRSHGLSKSPLYAVWNMMRQRCINSHNPSFKSYGGRNVKVCERWNSFEAFYEDMGEAPFVGASLDRIDATGTYCKDNVRWADAKTQNNNTRKSVRFEVFGESLSLQEAAERYGINPKTLSTRVYRSGMSLEDAVSRPVLTHSEAATMARSGGWGQTNKRTDGRLLYSKTETQICQQ